MTKSYTEVQNIGSIRIEKWANHKKDSPDDNRFDTHRLRPRTRRLRLQSPLWELLDRHAQFRRGREMLEKRRKSRFAEY